MRRCCSRCVPGSSPDIVLPDMSNFNGVGSAGVQSGVPVSVSVFVTLCITLPYSTSFHKAFCKGKGLHGEIKKNTLVDSTFLD